MRVVHVVKCKSFSNDSQRSICVRTVADMACMLLHSKALFMLYHMLDCASVIVISDAVAQLPGSPAFYSTDIENLLD